MHVKKNNFKIILQNAEAILTFDNISRFDSFAIHYESLKFIDRILVNNNSEKNKLLKYFREVGESDEKIVDFGCLRYLSFFHADSSFENKNKVRNSKNIKILFNCTSSKFHYLHSKSEYKQHLISEGLMDSHAEDILAWGDYYQYALFSFLEFVRIFKTNGYEFQVTVRPHPSDDIVFYEKLFRDCAGVSVNCTDNITAAIASNDVVISVMSTTLIEASLLEKKAINYLPHVSMEIENLLNNHEVNSCCEIIRTPEDLLQYILTEPSMKKISELKENAKKHFGFNYLNDDGIVNAFEFKCDELVKPLEKVLFFLNVRLTGLFYYFVTKIFKNRFSYTLQKSRRIDDSYKNMISVKKSFLIAENAIILECK